MVRRGERKKTSRRRVNGKRDVVLILQSIFELATRSSSTADFLPRAAELVAGLLGCDAVRIILREGEGRFRVCEFDLGPVRAARNEVRSSRGGVRCLLPDAGEDEGMALLMDEVLMASGRYALPSATKRGSFFTNDTSCRVVFRPKAGGRGRKAHVPIGSAFASLAAVPIDVEMKRVGVLLLGSARRGFFSARDVALCEDAAQSLGIAMAYHMTRGGARERVKELTCLYAIARVAERRDLPLHEVMRVIVGTLPAAWQYPEHASARIVLDGRTYETEGFDGVRQKQEAPIEVDGRQRGRVEVGYREARPEHDEGPFLKEERKLIDAVASEIALIVEQRGAEDARAALREQLRHADRLATIGQLAAGVAHELNEPLGNILGFAQLVQKSGRLPSRAAADVDKIVSASLHAREIIKKLMFFGRQMPPKKVRVSLNRIVEEGLYFLRSRCASAGVEVRLDLALDLPEIVADPSQLHQVLVNLVVNAIQAMPRGGTLTIGTAADDGRVRLVVRDTGAGMSPDVLRQIFIPFFTTKGIDQGTGLGLPVVHGIVTAHGGTIGVKSEEGRGTVFDVRLPVRTAEADGKG